MPPVERLRKQLRVVFDHIIQHPSPNWSSRRGAVVRASVVHTTESSDYSFGVIVDYLSRRGVPASSHYVIDALPRPGERFTRVAQLVREDRKAWTVLSANPVTNNYELIGRARRTRVEWLRKYRAQLETLAALIADDVLERGLPIKRAFPGILGHTDLDRFGFPQTHWDPGPGFPWPEFLDMVRGLVKEAQRPSVRRHPVTGEPRPDGVPMRIPRWAWPLMKWHDSGREGPRPTEVEEYVRKHDRIPQWYWHWRSWRRGVPRH